MNQNAKSLEKKDFNNLSKLLNDNILTSSGYKSSKYVDYFAKTNANYTVKIKEIQIWIIVKKNS